MKESLEHRQRGGLQRTTQDGVKRVSPHLFYESETAESRLIAGTQHAYLPSCFSFAIAAQGLTFSTRRHSFDSGSWRTAVRLLSRAQLSNDGCLLWLISTTISERREDTCAGGMPAYFPRDHNKCPENMCCLHTELWNDARRQCADENVSARQ